jgi:hypothetical protein
VNNTALLKQLGSEKNDIRRFYANSYLRFIDFSKRENEEISLKKNNQLDYEGIFIDKSESDYYKKFLDKFMGYVHGFKHIDYRKNAEAQAIVLFSLMKIEYRLHSEPKLYIYEAKKWVELSQEDTLQIIEHSPLFNIPLNNQTNNGKIILNIVSLIVAWFLFKPKIKFVNILKIKNDFEFDSYENFFIECNKNKLVPNQDVTDRELFLQVMRFLKMSLKSNHIKIYGDLEKFNEGMLNRSTQFNDTFTKFIEFCNKTTVGGSHSISDSITFKDFYISRK